MGEPNPQILKPLSKPGIASPATIRPQEKGERKK